jgi:hypothetical protein
LFSLLLLLLCCSSTVSGDLFTELYGDLPRPTRRSNSNLRAHASTTTTMPTTTTHTNTTTTTAPTAARAVMAHRRAQSLGTWLVPTGSTAVPVVAMATPATSGGSPRLVVKAAVPPNFDAGQVADDDDNGLYAGLPRRPRRVAAHAVPAAAPAARFNPVVEVILFFFFFFFFFFSPENFHFHGRSRLIGAIGRGLRNRNSRITRLLFRTIRRNICIPVPPPSRSLRERPPRNRSRSSSSSNSVVFVV